MMALTGKDCLFAACLQLTRLLQHGRQYENEGPLFTVFNLKGIYCAAVQR